MNLKRESILMYVPMNLKIRNPWDYQFCET